MNRSAGLLLCGLVCIGLSPVCAKELKLECTFADGHTKGSLPTTVVKAALDPKADFVALDKPGESALLSTVKLTRVPNRVFLSFEGRVASGLSGASGSVYSVRVNEETVVGPIDFNIDTYTSIGHDIAKACRKGENRISVLSEKGSPAPLQIRKVSLAVGEGIGTNDWVIFGLLALAILLGCRWIWFELFWKVMGANPITATRVSIILTALLLFLAYLYSFGSLASLTVSVVVGAGLLIVALIFVLR